MSHDGIRIVSPEQAAREAARELPPLSRDAVIPVRVRVKKTEGTGVEIAWKDGHHSRWTFAWLRDACPCATCHEARIAEGRDPGVPKPKPASLFALYEEPARPREAATVGNYALRFVWNDGHDSGIYSWEYLRSVCRCDACLARLGASAAAASAGASTPTLPPMPPIRP